MTFKKIFLTALLAVTAQLVMAQGVRISGTLSDSEGPVMMGNVVEIDANNRIVSAAQTDFNGNFTLQIKSTKNKLKFSYVGDKDKVITIGNQITFKVTLEPANTQLKEVKVVGRRSNSGGLMIQHVDGAGGRSGIHLGRRGPAGRNCRSGHRGHLG